jgi:hypothetical protein
MHKRLPIQSLIIKNGTPILIVVNTYILFVLRDNLQESGKVIEGV